MLGCNHLFLALPGHVFYVSFESNRDGYLWTFLFIYTSQFYIPFNNPHTYVKLSWYEYGIRMVSFRNFNIQRVFHLVISTKYQYVSGITILVLVMILFVDTLHSPIYWSNIDEHLILHTVNSMKLGCRQLACDRNVLTLMINTSILAFPSCELVHGSSQDVHVA